MTTDPAWHKRVTVWLLGQHDPVVFEDAYPIDEGKGWLHISQAGIGFIASFRWTDVKQMTAHPLPCG